MKRGMFLLVVLLLSSILFFPLISATEEESALGGYACLESIVDQRGCNALSTQERAFLVISADYCRGEVLSDMNSANSCWPSNACNVKDTAQAVFALYEKREDVEDSKDWLLDQAIPVQGLEWFLEVETAGPTDCTVTYGGETHAFVINQDKTISGDVGSCLRITPEGFWFEINPSCFDEEFEVVCGEAFLTTLLFKKADSSAINVLSDVEHASAEGKTTPEVSARCFTNGNGGGCNYEASLWATFALWASGEEVSSFVPYLTAMKNDNPIYLPEAFLYFLTGEFGNQLLDKQIQFSYWSESGDSYYDTALALWPMRYESSDQKQNAKDWLMTTQIRSGDNQGCWDSGDVRNTAFILRSVWYEYSPSYGGSGTQCLSNTDCPIGQLCNSDGVCYDPNGAECQSDNDCEVEGEICSNGYCIDPDNPPVCGDGLREAYEECDGYEYGGQTCETLGLGSGNLHCNSDCTIDDSDCGGSSECTYNWDCEDGKRCESGQCVDIGGGIDWGGGGGGSGGGTDGGGIDWGGGGGGSGGGTDGGGSSSECSFDFQCDSGEICEAGSCVPEPDGIDENVDCTFDFQCEELYGPGWLCENETCFLGANITNACSFDFECQDDEVCEDGECISLNASICFDDGDCPGADICVGGFCQERDEDCVFDFECEELYGNGWRCEAGFCINSTKQCISYWDCDVGEDCVDGVCLEDGIECEFDYQCLSSEECVAGKCVAYGTGNETCQSDFDCSDWTQICVEGLCVDNEYYDCQAGGYHCMIDSQCEGQILGLYSDSCFTPYICCDTPIHLDSCFEQNGEICLKRQICIGGLGVNASGLDPGETCCLNGGYCLESEGISCDSDLSCQIGEECVGGYCVQVQEAYDCESNEGFCRTFECQEDEEISIVYSCEHGDSCCILKVEDDSGGSGIWLIIILLILISLVVAGILFRDKLKVYWLKVKSKFDKGAKKPMHGRRPGMPPHPHQGVKPKKQKGGFFNNLFGKKPPQHPQNRTPPHQRRPLRGPLAIQHAQRQAAMRNNKPREFSRKPIPTKPSPMKPSPAKSTATPFKKHTSGLKISKKKVPENKPELDEVLDKLKKMSKKEHADKKTEHNLSKEKHKKTDVKEHKTKKKP